MKIARLSFLCLLFAAPCANAQLYDLSIDVQGGAYGSGTFSGILAYQNGSLAVNVSDPTGWVTPFTIACLGGCFAGNGAFSPINPSIVELVAPEGGTENLFLSFSLSSLFGSATGPTIAANSVSMSNGFDQPSECGVAAYPVTYGPGPMTCVSATLTPVTANTFSAPELDMNNLMTAMTLLCGTLCVISGRARREMCEGSLAINKLTGDHQ